MSMGDFIGHPHNISINSKAILGKNITIQSGVTIGKDFKGTRARIPKIGNDIYIGPNATIVGCITVGDDVLIAPNSFVNFDVHSHSIVIGVPGKIIPREMRQKTFW